MLEIDVFWVKSFPKEIKSVFRRTSLISNAGIEIFFGHAREAVMDKL